MKKTELFSKIVDYKMPSILLLLFLCLFIILSLWFQHKLDQSQKRRYLSYVAADELRQSSDDLTRMVRTYVMTKKPRYEKMYWDILAIRNGEKARPLRYENIYWDFMAFSNEKPRPDGQKISLLKIMENLAFTQEEFMKLATAEMHSNNLVKKEMIAMHAMKGEFLDSEGEFKLRGEPDYDYARTILYDESYHSDKVAIMNPIDEFFVLVNTRTEAQVNRNTIYTYICIFLVYMTIILLLLLAKVELNERKKSEKKLAHMAYYDQLTCLPNRANFISHLKRMLEKAKRQSDYLFAVLFIDLDNFKIINDSLGHSIGDRLLIEVARRLEVCTRPENRTFRDTRNDRISRFGGDEFAVFLNDIKDVSSASRVSERIQIELKKPLYIDKHELYTSASIGIALSATGYEKAEDILRDADSAMYRAKSLGRARAEIFDDEMRVKVTQILKLESDLRIAVEKEQFEIYYQPIVSSVDMKITGAEALIRWNHPEQGLIMPNDFISTAEETGLISIIGEWVLRTACAQNKAWQDAGYPNLLMKVNFSSRQFKDKGLTELVKNVIRETGLPAKLLDVEITESIAMEKGSILILNQMTSIGLRTSMDDFGTGYSSLAFLTEFSLNTIKIDKIFIENLTISSTAEAIIKAIIAMAHSLNMEVIAEGVETEEQLVFLQSQKCDKIQGYFFSRPVPEDEFMKLLEQEKSNAHN